MKIEKTRTRKHHPYSLFQTDFWLQWLATKEFAYRSYASLFSQNNKRVVKNGNNLLGVRVSAETYNRIVNQARQGLNYELRSVACSPLKMDSPLPLKDIPTPPPPPPIPMSHETKKKTGLKSPAPVHSQLLSEIKNCKLKKAGPRFKPTPTLTQHDLLGNQSVSS